MEGLGLFSFAFGWARAKCLVSEVFPCVGVLQQGTLPGPRLHVMTHRTPHLIQVPALLVLGKAAKERHQNVLPQLIGGGGVVDKQLGAQVGGGNGGRASGAAWGAQGRRGRRIRGLIRCGTVWMAMVMCAGQRRQLWGGRQVAGSPGWEEDTAGEPPVQPGG